MSLVVRGGSDGDGGDGWYPVWSAGYGGAQSPDHRVLVSCSHWAICTPGHRGIWQQDHAGIGPHDRGVITHIDRRDIESNTY